MFDAVGLTGVAKENVLIQSGDCTVALLPQFGGKIASICVKNRELLHAPLAEVAPRTRTMAFDAGDASGWDECLPSVAACAVKTNSGVVEIPDHGDLWRVEWDAAGNREQDNHAGAETGRSNSITLRGECFSLPLALDRARAVAALLLASGVPASAIRIAAEPQGSGAAARLVN